MLLLSVLRSYIIGSSNVDDITGRDSPIANYFSDTQSNGSADNSQTTIDNVSKSAVLTTIDYMASTILQGQISDLTSTPSADALPSHAKWWTGNLTVLVGQLEAFSARVRRLIAEQLSVDDGQAWNEEIVSIVLLVCLLALAPFVFILIYRMTLTIQNYANGLSQKTKELRREKKRSDSLLYQMLPKSVALQLKLSKKVYIGMILFNQ
jgi:Heme NO binding associated